MGSKFKSTRSGGGGGGGRRRSSEGGGGYGGAGRRQQRRGGSLEPPPSKKRGRFTFAPRPAPPLPESLSAMPKFQKANKFLGAKAGYFFSRGKAGVGYYIDRVQIGEMGDKAKARLAASCSGGDGNAASTLKKGTIENQHTADVATVSSSQNKLTKEAKKKAPSRATAAAFAAAAGGNQRSGPKGEEDEEDEGSESEADSALNGAGSSEGDEGDDGDGNSSDEGDEDEEEQAEEQKEESHRQEMNGRTDDGSGRVGEKQKNGSEEGALSRRTRRKDTTLVKAQHGAAVGMENDQEQEDGEEGDGDSGSDGSDSLDNDDGDGDDDHVGRDRESENASVMQKGKRQAGDSSSTVATNDASKAGEKGAAVLSGRENETQQEPEQEDEKVTFQSLGVTGPLCEAANQLDWTHATEIQRQALPLAFQGSDVIGLAETGSGKTGAFAIPILQALLANPHRLFAVVLAPTRELAFQINEVMEALGVGIGLKTVCIVGGIDMFQQSVALAKKPHVVIATPGRLVDHLENTKGFSLRTVKFLVLDEADRMLGLDFEEEINKILTVLPRERRTFLFSATMTSKVAKLQRASLKDPARVEVTHKFATPKTLVQQYLFIPAKHKDCYLAYVLNEFAGQSTIVFVSTCNNAQRVALLLRNLGFQAVCLHGQMGQPKRLGALGKFKSGQRNVLIATDVASRGLDIPSVDLVVNFEIPSHGKDYIHRVGRTARAGRAGRSIAFVTQYDVEVYQRMEALIGQKLPAYSCDEETVLVLQERVGEAQRMAAREMREADFNKRGKGKRGGGAAEERDDTETVVRSFKRQRMGGGGGGRGGKGGGRGRRR